jgi:hypothetical protein
LLKLLSFFRRIIMASASKFVAMLVAGRAAGTKNAATGVQHGGTYYPEHITNGKKINARWEGNVYINGMNYTDPTTGEYREGKAEVIRVVAWNGNNAKPGGGLADLCAKAITAGKELSCELDVNTFKKRLFIDDKPQVDHLGREIMVNGTSFVMKGLPIWGADADAVIQNEIANYRATGQATFAARPQFWNVVGHADAETWDFIKRSRKEMQYISGSTTYGHARVMLPAGAQLINAATPGMPAGIDPNMVAMLQAMMRGQVPAPAVVPAPTPAPAPVQMPPQMPAGIDPVAFAKMLASFGTVPTVSVPPVSAAAGTMLSGQMPI